MANVIAVQSWTINNIGDEHSVMVEHIGVEPMTSSPKAFGAARALASFDEVEDIFPAFFLFDCHLKIKSIGS